jgi:uncharacterized protein YjiS (DUF1127 family)
MSASTTRDIESSLTTADGSIDIDSLVSTIAEQQEQIDELTETVEDQQREIESLRDELEDRPTVAVEDGDPLGSLTVDGAPVGRAITSKPSETDVESMIEDSNPTPNGGETTIQDDDVTPIERLSRADDVSDVTDSISVERAVSLFRNVTDWGRKTPKGYTLRPTDRPKELLESARDERLNWKQYYRACRALERLSEGAITFVNTEKHGNTVVFHEKSDVFSRMTEGLSPSTERGTV